MGGKFAAFVLANHRINGFMGDAYTLLLQTAGYLPWRPLIVPYQFNDAPSQHIVQPSVARRMTQAGPCHVVGFVPYILAVRRGVTSYFTAYRRFVDSYGAGNHLQSLTLLFSQVNCVPLLTG